MFLRQYISSGVSNLIALFCLTMAVMSFGYPAYFDRLFIIFMFGFILFNPHNANVISIALIFILERLIEEVIFAPISVQIVIPLIYFFSFWLIKLCWYDKLVRWTILPTIILCIICEIYWSITAYDSPRIVSYIGMLMINMITRHLIFLRVPIFKKIMALPFIKNTITQPLKNTSIDLPLYQLMMINNWVVIIMIAEYLVRHLTVFQPLVIYTIYSQSIHVLSSAMLFFIFNFIIKSTYKFDA